MGHLTPRLVFVLAGAAALAAALVAASQLSAGENDRVATPQPVAHRAFAGVPQSGLVLGREDAPVTLVEYADVQCPYCAEWARRTLPTLVDEYVRAGKLRIVFHGLAFLGPDSVTALRATLAAGRQDRLWDVLDALYRSQGAENSGWVSDELVDGIASSVAGLDVDRLRADMSGAWFERASVEAAAAARAAGVTGTPTFQVGPTGGTLELVRLESLGPEGLRPSIDALLAR